MSQNTTYGKIGNFIEQHEINVKFRRFYVLVEGLNKKKTILYNIYLYSGKSSVTPRPDPRIYLFSLPYPFERVSKFSGRVSVSVSVSFQTIKVIHIQIEP